MGYQNKWPTPAFYRLGSWSQGFCPKTPIEDYQSIPSFRQPGQQKALSILLLATAFQSYLLQADIVLVYLECFYWES